MKVFRKELMLKRLEHCNLMDQVTERFLNWMDELDGKEVYENTSSTRWIGEYLIEDKNGRTHLIDKKDVEEVSSITRKKEERDYR